MEFIRIRGARTHNLKNINLDLPRNQLIVITGLSGSGKSSLAFDTLYAEGQRRYVESLSAYEDFKRTVWLEASVRGVKSLGYEPNPGDLEVLKREREARQVNRIEPARDASSGTAAAPAEKASARGGGGRKAVLAAVEAVLVAKKVPEKQRAAVMAAATEKLVQRIRDGQVPKVKVYDKAAPSQRPVVVPTPEMQRSRDRAAPAPAR